MNPEILFIVGPTASGKTSLALDEACARGAVILSCDSLCFYRGMDIGTAKPSPEEQARVKHFGIDLVEPDDGYSVARYLSYRDSVLEEARGNGTPVVVVGGSGFYLKSFFFPVVDEMVIPAAVTKEAELIRRSEGPEGLVKRLRQVNPDEEAFPGLDLQNPRRVEKALIRCLASGRSYAQLRAEFLALPTPLSDWTKEVWLMDRPVEELQERNRARVKQMLKSGLVEEVQSLRERGFERNPSAAGAIGYREVLDCLDGRLPPDQLAEHIYIHTNQLMRRQRTWFRSQIPVNKVITGD